MYWQLAHLLGLLEKKFIVLHNIIGNVKIIEGSTCRKSAKKLIYNI
jgi:hypothetical protein